jgi:hypothetical protein
VCSYRRALDNRALGRGFAEWSHKDREVAPRALEEGAVGDGDRLEVLEEVSETPVGGSERGRRGREEPEVFSLVATQDIIVASVRDPPRLVTKPGRDCRTRRRR